MRIAFITRSTLYSDPGGDTVQVVQTARHLQKLGVEVDILRTNERISYHSYHLLHFFNLTRPADILYHIEKSNVAFVVSPILVDYSEYDRMHRTGIGGSILRIIPAGANEYVKTIARWVMGKDVLRSWSYLWKGQRKSIEEILRQTSAILPNSESEYKQVQKTYNISAPWYNVPNGVDIELFSDSNHQIKDPNLVICAGRIEGRKNQLNLIRALNETNYKLLVIGAPASNQRKYYEQCRDEAASNISFIGKVEQHQLIEYYQAAKVHALPSWFETCGLSSLEAAAMGCNIVVTEKGFTRDYFGDEGFYCDPASPDSIFEAVENAATADPIKSLQQKVRAEFTWQKAAAATLHAYQNVLITSKTKMVDSFTL
jgi:glycosyltransferase involved in cell wall biosynthesis